MMQPWTKYLVLPYQYTCFQRKCSSNSSPLVLQVLFSFCFLGYFMSSIHPPGSKSLESFFYHLCSGTFKTGRCQIKLKNVITIDPCGKIYAIEGSNSMELILQHVTFNSCHPQGGSRVQIEKFLLHLNLCYPSADSLSKTLFLKFFDLRTLSHFSAEEFFVYMSYIYK